MNITDANTLSMGPLVKRKTNLKRERLTHSPVPGDLVALPTVTAGRSLKYQHLQLRRRTCDVHSRRPRCNVAAVANLHHCAAGDSAAHHNLARVISFYLQLLTVEFPIRSCPCCGSSRFELSFDQQCRWLKVWHPQLPPPVPPPVPEPPLQAPKLFTCIDTWDLIRGVWDY